MVSYVPVFEIAATRVTPDVDAVGAADSDSAVTDVVGGEIVSADVVDSAVPLSVIDPVCTELVPAPRGILLFAVIARDRAGGAR